MYNFQSAINNAVKIKNFNDITFISLETVNSAEYTTINKFL